MNQATPDDTCDPGGRVAITRDPGSDAFIVTCDVCGRRVHVGMVTLFDAARRAQASGWTIAASDTCRECVAPPVKVRRR